MRSAETSPIKPTDKITDAKINERTTTLKQQIKARKYLIKHNIVKKRENFYGLKKQNDSGQPQTAGLGKYLKRINEEEEDAYSMTAAIMAPLPHPLPCTAAHVFYGSRSRLGQLRDMQSIPESSSNSRVSIKRRRKPQKVRP